MVHLPDPSVSCVQNNLFEQVNSTGLVVYSQRQCFPLMLVYLN